MKVFVLIIAHNEEVHIESCIQSILSQSKKAHEVMLVVHNSSDRTCEYAKKYPEISVFEHTGEAGAVYARIEAIKHAQSEGIILCIDGDSVAKNNWIEMLANKLSEGNILVGTYVKIKGTLYNYVTNIWNYFFCVSKGKHATPWLWGASFGFHGNDKEFVIDCLQKSIIFSKKIGVALTAEDYWLALYMEQKGNIEVTNETYVTAHAKETKSYQSLQRSHSNVKNGKIIKQFFDNAII